MIILIDTPRIIYLAKSMIESIEVNRETHHLEITTCHYRYLIDNAVATRDEELFMEKFGSTSYMNAFSILDSGGRHSSIFITGKITKVRNQASDT